MGDDEKDADTYYQENGYGDGDGDNVSILSYDVQGDHIPSLHQKAGEEPKKVRKAEPPATSLEPEADETPISIPEPAPRETVQKAPVPSMSYEEERATIDFDDVVRQNQEKYRAEKSQSNTEVGHDYDVDSYFQVLDNIAREEGEDRPNISQLLAWAKGK